MEGAAVEKGERHLYGYKGSFDVTNHEQDLNHMIIASSKSRDQEFQPSMAFILEIFNSFEIKNHKYSLNTQGPVSAITTNRSSLKNILKYVIIAPNNRNSQNLLRFWLYPMWNDEKYLNKGISEVYVEDEDRTGEVYVLDEDQTGTAH